MEKTIYQIVRNTENCNQGNEYLINKVTQKKIFGIVRAQSRRFIARYGDLEKAKEHVEKLKEDGVVYST